MIRDICHEVYQISAANHSKETGGKGMPFTENELQQMLKEDDPYTVDLSEVMDLPPMEYVNALYRMFLYRLNDRKEHWRKLAGQLSETDFKRVALESFLKCRNVEMYHLKVINNPFESRGNRSLHLIARK